MATDHKLLHVHPPQLTFVFEPNKQSSCLLHLSNNASHHVAFKVKTTSPKKYCVRPTLGIVNPHGTCHFTVTMQAQRTAPPDFNCKDKFLLQTAVVPSGTTQDQISSHMFLKDNGSRVQETKLRVLLISPPSSPVNAHFNQMPPPLTVEKRLEAAAEDMEDEADKDNVPRCVEKVGDMNGVNDVVKLTLAKDSEGLNSRLSAVDAKLREEMLKKKIKMRRAQGGFPFLFVCVVSLVSMAVGYYIHP
ncbi:vesicle-associated protein 1-2 isoform X3 [Cajanus cajan]|uniref:vesicle-associated protein 1-2 isoform X3 n=1 Tax=Cajanus cajan TaxID=3821 RepID=UPI00098DD473|nr:vesicle-associated protein 1-2 isoform X3 [Cajanus cajan]